jgi:hypothetical protein
MLDDDRANADELLERAVDAVCGPLVQTAGQQPASRHPVPRGLPVPKQDRIKP